MDDTRHQQLHHWTGQVLSHLLPDLPGGDLTLSIVSGDASFRRYFRLEVEGHSYMAVDAPPEHEDNPRFVRICNLFREAGVQAPKVFATDYDQGFLLLEDFGDDLYLTALLEAQQAGDLNLADTLYRDAIDALVTFQGGLDSNRLDPYDRGELHREMTLFDEWFCAGLLKQDLDATARKLIAETYEFLEDAALAQTVVAVHRDYHSRNLLRLDEFRFGTGPGIIDFQDAVAGACTYDLVSLLRDCYIRWDESRVEQWAHYYYDRAVEQRVISDIDFAQLQRDMDLMGLQRHLKVMGIFSRLDIRDKKSRYLADIPLVIRYFLDVAGRHPELDAFVDWFRHTLLPAAKSQFNQDF